MTRSTVWPYDAKPNAILPNSSQDVTRSAIPMKDACPAELTSSPVSCRCSATR